MTMSDQLSDYVHIFCNIDNKNNRKWNKNKGWPKKIFAARKWKSLSREAC